jgi:hypothetical protein
MRIFPGSMNLILSSPFDWLSSELEPHLIRIQGEEMGGESDGLMYPANLPDLDEESGFRCTSERGILERSDHRLLSSLPRLDPETGFRYKTETSCPFRLAHILETP